MLLALGALSFVTAGLVIGSAGGWRASSTVLVATYLGVPFFGLCFLYLIYRLGVPKPAVVVSTEGILDNATALGVGMIRWDEIREVRATSVGTERMIAIVPKDEAVILARQNPVKRLFLRMNKGIANYIVCIPESVLPMTREELLGELRRYRRIRRTKDQDES